MCVSDISNPARTGAIRVLHIGPDISARGGIASVIRGYAENKALFDSLGYELSFQGTCGNTDISWIRQFIAAWWRIVTESISGKVDIVHLHTSVRGSLIRKCLLAVTCIGLRQKYVVHFHSGAMSHYVDTLPALGHKAVWFVGSRAAQLICLSRDMQDWVSRRWQNQHGKCPLIYNGILDPVQDGFSRASPRAKPAILFLGKLIESKGALLLVKAAKKLKQRGIAFELLIGGNGDVREFLAEVERHDLADEVRFLGWVAGEQKAQLLASADVFVLPSRSEGFPVAVIEAMAFGAVVVSTSIPGVMDAVTHQREGWLVAPDDAEALCEALFLLITTPALRSQLTASARQRFLEHFTIQRTAERLASVYQQVIP